MSSLDASNGSSSICNGVREQLLLLDANLRVKTASPSFYEGFNVTPEQTIDHGLSELGNGQWNNPALLTLLKELQSGDGAFNDFEVEHDFPGLGHRTMLLSARRVPAQGTAAEAILLGFEDITRQRGLERELAMQRAQFETTLTGINDAVILTERRRLEAELVKQRAYFETTISAVSDAVIVTDTKTHVTYMNSTAQFLTGWSQNEAAGSLLAVIFHIVDEHQRQPMESPVDKAIREGAIVGPANHTLLIAKDGRHFLINDSAAPIRDKTGAIVGVVLVFHDITQQRHSRQQLEISELRYRRLFEKAHDGILILNAKTAKVLEVNFFLQHLLGYPAEYFLGKELWELGIFHDADCNKAAMVALQKTGSIRYDNLPLKDKAGRHIPVEFVSNVYSEGDHDVIQCNIRDIAVRRAAEEELCRVKEAAESANRAKSEFLANMSHEIRTPMTAILGFSDMMLQPNQDPHDRTECIHTVRRNAVHLLELINDILDLSKIEAGKMTVERIRCNLAKFLGDLIALMRPRAVEKGLEFEVVFDGPIPYAITTDPTRLRQILVNLLGNAVKFSTAGKINLRIRAEFSDADKRFCLEVTDTGIGLAPEQIKRLFQPFTQADESTTRKFGGTGLGLTISQRLARLLGGQIDVKSELGVGSTFTVRIDGGSFANVPMAKNMNEVILTQTPPPGQWLDIPLKGRILLVEDGRDNQRLLSTHLRSAGAEVIIAENGQIAVDLVDKSAFDLVLMDMQMPVMDGYTATSELRRRGFTLPIIALTAYALAEDKKKCMADGCTDYLSKPIERELLLNTVRQHLNPAAGSVPGESSSDATPPATAIVATNGPMKSSIKDRPGMEPIIAEFVEGLPEKVRFMADFLQRNDLNALRRMVHQLRGSGGSYGFAPITGPATQAEEAIMASENLDTITEKVNSLIHTLRRIEGFDSSKEQPPSSENQNVKAQ